NKAGGEAAAALGGAADGQPASLGVRSPAAGAGGHRAAPTAATAAGAATGRLLRPDLAFDGTHLAPAYVPLLDAALRAVP
ncbi:hypothetical protein TSOC_013140, partial [Tetrabaena socialis]